MTLRTLVPIAAALPLLFAACDRGTPEDAAAPAAPAGETAQAEEAEDDALACELVRAVAQIESVRLESADGACRVYLPSEATAGTLAVRVSAAGTPDAAAVEYSTDDGTLYATGGEVTLTQAADGRWVGSLDATDDAEPGTGRIAGSFDVTTGGD